MAQARTIQRRVITIASVALHAVILAALGLHQARRPRLLGQDDVFTVTILPRYLTPKENLRRPKPQQKVAKKDYPSEVSPVAPRILPPHPSPAPPQPIQPTQIITAEQLGQALRNGGVGCNPPGLPGLSREAREICEGRLASGARNAGYLGNGMARNKQAAFDQDTAAGNAWRKHGVPPGMGNTDVSAEAALKRNQMAPGRPGDTQATWGIAKVPF